MMLKSPKNAAMRPIFTKYVLMFSAAIMLLSTSCSLDHGHGREPLPEEFHNSVFIVCEGVFPDGTASLSVYDTVERKIRNDVFYNRNGFPPGAVMQSMKIIDGRGYLVMNCSGKVMVIDTLTCRHLGTITGLVSPRYVEAISPEKLYISDLYDNVITVVDPRSLASVGKIQVGATTEQMIRLGDNVYVCSWSYNNKVYKIDTRTDRVVDSVVVANQPNSMVLDGRGMLWTISDGGYDGMPGGKQKAALTQIDPARMSVVRVMEFDDIVCAPSRLTVSGAGDVLYFVDNRYGATSSLGGVFCLSIDAQELPSAAFIPQGTRLFYGMNIDPRSGEIYVSDAVDYQSPGRMLRYSTAGVLIDEQTIGLIPRDFCF